MYNPKDIQFCGKHDYDKEASLAWADSQALMFSIGVFQWVMKSSGKGMKRSSVKVRVKGHTSDKEKVFEVAEKVVAMLDNGKIFKKKTITVK